jgi:nucleotide-binding universal stress UspA family protein
MRILLALDDSPHSRRALERVREMQWPAGTTVSVVSAVRVAPVLAYAEFQTPGTLPVEPVFEDRVHVHEALVRHAEGILRGSGLQVQGRVLHGDAREAIVDAARREKADLIVMGSHGRTGLARLLMGSVAAHVVAHAPCDVLVVRMAATLN